MKRISLNRNDRILLGIMLVIAVLAALVATFAAPIEKKGGMFDQPSTFHNDETGAKAAFLVLDQLGYRVGRFRRPISTLTVGEIDSLAILGPITPYSDEELHTLFDWIRSGHTLMYCPGSIDALQWFKVVELDRMTSPAAEIAMKNKAILGEQNASLLRGVEQLRLRPKLRFDVQSPVTNKLGNFTATTIWSDDEGSIILRVPVDRGQIIAVSDPYIFSNIGLDDADNAVLLANLAVELGGPNRNARIGFDEYHHGYAHRDMSSVAMLKLLARNGRWWGAVQLAIAVALMLYLATVRFGIPRDRIIRKRRQQSEFVRAAGRLLQSAKGEGLAWSTLHQKYTQALTRLLNLPPDVAQEELYAAVEKRTGINLSKSQPRLKHRLSSSELLHIHQRYYDAMEALKRGA